MSNLLPTAVITGKARGSYMNPFEPRPDDNGVLKYSGQALIPKTDTATLKAISAAILEAKKIGVKKFGWDLENLPKKFKSPVRDGDAELADGTKKEKDKALYEGCYFINATSKFAPGVVDKNGKEILKASEAYSGAFYRFEFNFYPYETKGNIGIAAGLNAVQKIAEGERLGGGGSDGSNFGAYESTEEEEEIPFITAVATADFEPRALRRLRKHAA